MAHWKQMMDRKLFDAGDLDGRERVVQIASVKAGEVEGRLGGKFSKTRRPLVALAGFDRPWALNSTNAKMLTTVLGTPDTAAWAGAWVIVYPAVVECPEGMVEAIRVKPAKPTAAQIAAAQVRPPGVPTTDAPPDPVAVAVCEAIDAAQSAGEIDTIIADHRDALNALDKRSKAIVAAAKKARVATLAQPAVTA